MVMKRQKNWQKGSEPLLKLTVMTVELPYGPTLQPFRGC